MNPSSDEVPLGASPDDQPEQPPAPQEETRGHYDTSRSIKMKTLPQYVEDIRYKDPQGTIDYLYARKEAYKNAAARHQRNSVLLVKKVKEQEAKTQEAEERLVRLKAKLKEETAMRKWWNRAFVLMAIFSGLIGLMFIAILMFTIFPMLSRQQPSHEPPKVPTSGHAQATPTQVLSSVNLLNGEKQGSGVIISKGDKYAAMLSAAHNFRGKIGGWVWTYYADGTYTKAILLAVDRDRDLALLRVPADTILAHSYIPPKIFKGEISGVGYTGGQGPNWRRLVYERSYATSANKYMWEFTVREGPFWDGDSGSAVYIDDATIGITSQRDAVVWTSSNSYYKRLYACSRPEIVAFLDENKEKLDGCGDPYKPPEQKYGSEDAPPLWSPKPNVPIFTQSKNERLIAELRADVDNLKKIIGDPKGLRRPSDVPKEKQKGPELKKPSEIK